MKTPLLAALLLASLAMPAAHADTDIIPGKVFLTDRTAPTTLTMVQTGPPVAVAGPVRLQLAPDTIVTVVGVGVASPCEPFPAELQCVANPIVTPLYVPSLNTNGPEVVTVYQVVVHVDANGDGFDDARFPGVEIVPAA